MIFYCQKRAQYAPANKLQAAVQQELAPFGGLMVENPDALEAHLQTIVQDQNTRHPKCRLLRIKRRAGATETLKSIFDFETDEMVSNLVLSFSLEVVTGEFVALPGVPAQVVPWDEQVEATARTGAAILAQLTDSDLLELRHEYQINLDMVEQVIKSRIRGGSHPAQVVSNPTKGILTMINEGIGELNAEGRV